MLCCSGKEHGLSSKGSLLRCTTGRERAHAAILSPLCCPMTIGAMDAGVEHSGCCFGLNAGLRGFTEAVELRPCECDNDARLSTELAGAEGDRVDEPLRDGFGALGERRGKKKDGVNAAHLGIHGDGDFAGGGQRDQSATDLRDPVNPTARMAGCLTSASPTELPLPTRRENTPSGNAQSATVF